MPPVRLGAVDYLNVRPLVYGLEHDVDRLTLRFDAPSECARLLAAGEIDLGMVPSIAHLDRPGDRIVPGVCIGSVGAVASVALFHRVPLREVRSIALDTSSRTSVALTRVLCARRLAIDPVWMPHPPDLSAMLAKADAALLIGDPALFVDHAALGAGKLDLGEAWTVMTGLPFVWAFWAGRADAAPPWVVSRLQSAAREGFARLDEIADRYLAQVPARQATGRRYLREHLAFAFDAAAREGLRCFYQEARAVGAAAADGPLEFFDDETA